MRLKKAMWISSTIFCVSLAGCCNVSPMPARPPVVRHERDPVISHHGSYYKVTPEMVQEAAVNKIYVREVGIWQRENNLR